MAQITVSTGSLYCYGLERALRIISMAGLTSVELMTRDFGKEGWADSWDVAYLQDTAAAHELAYRSVHAPFGIEDGRHDEYLERTCRLALELGADDIILHIPRRGQESYKEWFDDFVLGTFGGRPRVLIENMGTKACYNEQGRFMEYPNFCYDLCHAVQACRSIADDLAAMSNVRQLHISSFVRDGDRTHMGILSNKAEIGSYVALAPDATRCIEISPAGFGADIMNIDSVVSALAQTRTFLEGIV